MKSIPTKVICFTSAGYQCYHAIKPSKKEAIKTAKELIDEGYAFSYKLYDVK
jgi:hypothetical protein